MSFAGYSYNLVEVAEIKGTIFLFHLKAFLENADQDHSLSMRSNFTCNCI
jgi:hypothetical protein